MATIAEIAARAGLSPSTVSLVLRKKPPYSEEAARRVEEAVKALDYQAPASTVTARDVAALAGVSVATVSNVVNGYPVSAAFQKMVNDAIQTLGYVPPVRNRPRAEKQKRILVVDDFSNRNISSGILSALEESDFEPWLLPSGFFRSERLEPLLEHGEACGVLFCNCADAALVQAVAQRFPTVQCGYYADLPDCDTVSLDYEWAAYELTRQMLRSGKTRPALLLDGADSAQQAALSEQGFRRACQEAGFPAAPERILPCSAHRQELVIVYEQHQDCFAKLLGLPQALRPDGLVLLNAQLALIYHSLVREAGLSIPESLSLACTDANLAFACTPHMAAMSYPCVDVGTEAVRQLLARIVQPERAAHRTLFRPKFDKKGSI